VLCNLTVEAGAKNGIVAPDDVTEAFLTAQGREYDKERFFYSDADCVYEQEFDYDLSALEPAVTSPHFVDNYDIAGNKERENIVINQGFIGACSNGRIEELRVAAQILKGKKITPAVRLLISPASQNVYLQAVREGLLEIFLDSGATVLNPNCSVCWGACQGVIGEGEVLISTGTRNFKGRAGSPDSFVYLGSAATVAASCIAGKIVDPRNYL
jgi:3-isopropylmalate/(R)-2-methylmalate dehydratase large subunit